jgi:hypothetical protein
MQLPNVFQTEVLEPIQAWAAAEPAKNLSNSDGPGQVQAWLNWTSDPVLRVSVDAVTALVTAIDDCRKLCPELDCYLRERGVVTRVRRTA